MIKKKSGWFGIMALLLLWSCSECEDCESTVNAPRTSFVFINQTSLDTLSSDLTVLDASLTELQATASVLTAENITLDSLLDSLSARIARGMIELREDSTSTANMLEANNQLLASNSENQVSLNAERATLVSTINTVQSGNLLVDTVTNLASGNALIFTDSTTVYKLPLDPNFNEMSYGFSIASMEYELTVTYVTTTSQNTRRNVLVGAESIGYSATTFDEVQIDPETDNTHATATIYCFF